LQAIKGLQEQMNMTFEQLDAKFDPLNTKIYTKVEQVEARIEQLDQSMGESFGALRAYLNSLKKDLVEHMERCFFFKQE
jgi:hypothetical protein